MSDKLQGWAVKINLLADHTYVYCPDNGKYFDCWGGHSGPDKRMICEGNGSYAVANCYRCPITIGGKTFPDTACIGVYAVDGVCHQSANCFLYSAGVTLNLKVRGYWASVLTYGPYGKLFPVWLLTKYKPCADKYKMVLKEVAMEDTPFAKLHAMYASFQEGKEPDPIQRVIEESKVLASHAVPGIDPGIWEDMHREYLKEVEGVVSSGLQGEELAQRINDLAIQLQKSLAEKISPEEYEKLFGLPPGEVVNLIDPAIAHAANKKRD